MPLPLTALVDKLMQEITPATMRALIETNKSDE